jgi:hypothetical protein
MANEKLINAVKKIMESEELGEMARKAYNNTLTEKGKKDISDAVKKMIADDKEKGTKNHESFAFKALHFLAKQKVGAPVLTTDIQKAAGCKFPQPINKLLASLVASEYLERASSHVEPEPKEPGQRGRPKGEEKPKTEKPAKLGGLNLAKPAAKKDEPAAEKEKEEEDDVKNLTENEHLDELEAELNESEDLNEDENINEESVEAIAKSLISKFGVDGNKEGGSGDLDEEYSADDNGNEKFISQNEAGSLQKHNVSKSKVDAASDEYYEKTDKKEKGNVQELESLNESMLTMNYRAGLINDTEFAKAKRKLLK